MINNYLRKSLEEVTKNTKKQLDAYKKYLNNALDECDFYEGVIVRGQDGWEGLGELREGNEFTVPYFWSFDKKRALSGNRYKIIVLNSKKGKNLERYSRFPNEDEVLYKTGSRFRIVETKLDKTPAEIYLEEVTNAKEDSMNNFHSTEEDEFVRELRKTHEEMRNWTFEQKVEYVKGAAHQVAYSCDVSLDEVEANPEKFARMCF